MTIRSGFVAPLRCKPVARPVGLSSPPGRACLAALVLCFLVASGSRAQTYSRLWGEAGELWSPQSRLPDFSFAGYHRGEAVPPRPAATHNVKDFGAVGDGRTDDSEAFLRAIEAVEAGVILIPRGRYRITRILEIRKPNLVLRGEDRDQTVLFFPKALNEIKPNWGATTEGRRTSNYAWSGGFLWVRGDYQTERLSDVTQPARRGDQVLHLSSVEGHFTELGFNPIAFSNVANAWVRRIRIRNADSGLFISARFCTIEDVVYESDRKPDGDREATGHHGIYLSQDDNVFSGFDIRTQFVHDISVSHCAGNVISSGRGLDLSLDHHRRAPYENLFTDIDAGEGTRLWRSGGGAALGKHCAARGTFWNIRARRPLSYPGGSFGPWSINLVGLFTGEPSETDLEGKWLEAIPPADLYPRNLHASQRARRLGD